MVLTCMPRGWPCAHVHGAKHKRSNDATSLVKQDKTITRDELVKHLHGNADEADKYMDLIDGYTSEGEQDPSGAITLDEWHEYFRYIAEDDTGVAETSPLACKALIALECVALRCSALRGVRSLSFSSFAAVHTIRRPITLGPRCGHTHKHTRKHTRTRVPSTHYAHSHTEHTTHTQILSARANHTLSTHKHTHTHARTCL